MLDDGCWKFLWRLIRWNRWVFIRVMEGWDDESLRFHAWLMSWSTIRVGFLMLSECWSFSTAISFRHVIGCAKFGSEKLGELTNSELDGKGGSGVTHQAGACHMSHTKKQLGGGFQMVFFYFHPYLGKIPILTNIFQMGWNHQPHNIYI